MCIFQYGVRYKWDSSAQALILGSFFWGYILTSIPGGFIAERFGPTKTIGISILISAALTMLTPLAASWHYGVVIATRFIIGFLCVRSINFLLSILFLIFFLHLTGSYLSFTALSHL